MLWRVLGVEPIRSTPATSGLDQPTEPLKLGWMDSKGVFWQNSGERVVFGSLWIHREMLDVVRPFGWRLLKYQRGNDMVEVGRSADVARQFMENTDEHD